MGYVFSTRHFGQLSKRPGYDSETNAESVARLRFPGCGDIPHTRYLLLFRGLLRTDREPRLTRRVQSGPLEHILEEIESQIVHTIQPTKMSETINKAVPAATEIEKLSEDDQHVDIAYQPIDPVEEAKVVRKLDRVILPLMAFVYFFQCMLPVSPTALACD